MSQIIEIIVEKKNYQIEWALSEYFGELKGKKFMLNKMAAEQIEMINNLSDTAKILLSAVAGAVIQHLIDNNCKIENIFEDGQWAILEWRDPLGLRGCGFFHVVNGKILFQRGYWDKLSFLKQHNLPIE